MGAAAGPTAAASLASDGRSNGGSIGREFGDRPGARAIEGSVVAGEGKWEEFIAEDI